MTKTCSKCGEEKSKTEFHSDKGRPDGLTSQCKACRNATSTQWNQTNRARYNENWRRHYSNNKEKRLDKGRESYMANREARIKRQVEYQRVSNYGVTPEMYQAMLDAQDNCCAICGEPFTKSAHVDHCHASGKVRALLCGGCNRGLGQFKDDPERLTAAATYLLEHAE